MHARVLIIRFSPAWLLEHEYALAYGGRCTQASIILDARARRSLVIGLSIRAIYGARVNYACVLLSHSSCLSAKGAPANTL